MAGFQVSINGRFWVSPEAWGPYGALKLVSEIGLDMRRWATEKHFVSWLAVAPRNQISGGKLLGSRTATLGPIGRRRSSAWRP